MVKAKKTKTHRDNWLSVYETKQPTYERLCQKLKLLLEDLLESAQIRYQVVEARAKTTLSLSEKLQREGKNYTDPLNEITDLAGVRIILYYVDDVEKVSDLIDREFSVDVDKSVDKKAALRLDQFGYLSVHKIVKLSESRSKLPEWFSLGRLAAEIQIRTVLQHSWAAISHALQYKHEADIPDASRRRLTRLSGLLELADEEFSALRTQQTNLTERIAEKVSKGNLDIGIDVLSIREFLDKSRIVGEYVNLADGLGYEVLEEGIEGIGQLIQACEFIGLRTVKAIENALIETKPIAKGFLREFLKLQKEQSKKTEYSVSLVSPEHIAALILVGARNPPLSQRLQYRMWNRAYASLIFKANQHIFRKKK